MSSKRISRTELDSFSANIVINLALINAAALAATMSSDKTGFSSSPYALGLMSAVLAQLFWHADSTFDYFLGKATEKTNETIGTFTSALIILFATSSATSVVFGCLSLLGLSAITAFLFAATLCFIPSILLLYTIVREAKFRSRK